MTANQPDQSRIEAKGKEILAKMEGQAKASLFSKDFWYGSIMDWSMKNEAFKTQMFRFVDVLPALQSSNEVAQHLKEYFAQSGEELPPVFNVGLGLGSLAPSLMAGAIRKNVTQMAKMFIAGENPKEALQSLVKARKNKIGFTVDILGEATLSEKEALEYQSKYMELISGLASEAAKWESVPQIDEDHLGPIPRVNVSVKLTALDSQIIDMAWEDTKARLKNRLRPILAAAQSKFVFLNLDMEHYGVKDLTLEVFEELLLEPELRSYPHFGCVIQAYLKDSLNDLKRLVQFSQKRGTSLTIRLVKGAYWDSETIEAQQKGWPIPVFENKAETDANYEACTTYMLENFKFLRPAFGSHNVRSIAHAMVTAERLGIPTKGIELQMLYGMADPIKKSLVDMGYRVREYAPLGELLPGMAYLVRRLLENTSNESWLRGKFAENKSAETLLQDPSRSMNGKHPSAPAAKPLFQNAALLDFAVAENRDRVIAAVQNKRAPQDVKPIINGKVLEGGAIQSRPNPSHSNKTSAQVHLATIEQAKNAVLTAHAGFRDWKQKSFSERAELLDALADRMLAKRFDLIATQILEVGKPWAEADADVCEAVDFCRYYAAHARKLDVGQRVGHAPGEHSVYSYVPRGVTAVIAPWNFPLAILTGMSAAALVTGNTVVMKPAEQSSWVAQELMQMMLEVGFPPSCVQFLPGLGEEVGASLVESAQVSTIAFTGSKNVGLHILKTASQQQHGQNFIKRCILELGGKNAVIVDHDADLDEAVDGVLYSAFGFAGQKCSACSRVIVLESVADRFEARLVEAARSLTIAHAENPKSYAGPVVDAEAQQRILQTIREAEQKHTLVFKGEVPNDGNFVPPVIFKNVNPQDSIAQEEIFGPVLVILKAKNLDEALQIANGTPYALTGGLYSRSPANIEKVRVQFECGNLYINRGITGAMVDRHPFGGFKMSGAGTKAGGPDYLMHFMDPRVVTENTMRRGFAPTED